MIGLLKHISCPKVILKIGNESSIVNGKPASGNKEPDEALN